MSKRSAQDCISDLPDSVLLYVLSFLDMEEVVRTSVLSKRWRHIWTSVSTLSLECHGSSDDETAKFVARVNTALPHFQQTRIEKFKIASTYCWFGSEIDNWVSFATNKKVRDLCLQFNDLDGCRYIVPQSVRCNSSLTNLSLCGCHGLLDSVSWPLLKNLSLDLLDFDSDTFTKILSGCPVLESLKIIECRWADSLVIESNTLREVEVLIDTSGWDETEILLLKISAPKLRILHFYGDFFVKQFQLLNIPSLVRAKLNFTHPVFSGDDDNKKQYENFPDNFIGFLESISHVKELELGVWFIQCLSHAMFLSGARALTTQFSSLTCLKLLLYNAEVEVPGIITLLKCSPNLETFVVNSCNGRKSFLKFPQRAKQYWRKEYRRSFRRGRFPLPHLKTVKFDGFFDVEDVDKYIHKLVQFLLKNAGHLGRITITGEEYQMILKLPKHAKTSR